MNPGHLAIFFLTLTFLAPIASAADAPAESLKKLFDENLNAADFAKVAAEATTAGVPQQTIAEAKLVWGLRHQDHAFLGKVLPELEAAAKDFKKENSAGLGSAEDFLALISYIRSLAAIKAGDQAGFKKHITEAFWLSPEQAALFAQTITTERSREKFEKIRLDLQLPITTSKSEKTNLAKLMGSGKGILLDFWASWCGPCMNLMPELRKEAAHLQKFGIVVCGMNTESDEAVAEKVRADKDMNMPWLVEPKDRPFSEPLEITSIPRTVLISPDGKILFNGHPQDPALWTALKGINGDIVELKE